MTASQKNTRRAEVPHPHLIILVPAHPSPFQSRLTQHKAGATSPAPVPSHHLPHPPRPPAKRTQQLPQIHARKEKDSIGFSASPLRSKQRQGMKRVVGSPGTWSGMALRLSQCVFAAASVFSLVSGFGYSNYSAYFYLNLASILQIMWSLGLACKDIFALRNKKDLHTRDNLLFIVMVDWVVGVFMFSGACASASLTIFFMWDVHFCEAYSRLACRQFALSVVLAFITWLLQAASSFSGLWLLVSFF